MPLPLPVPVPFLARTRTHRLAFFPAAAAAALLLASPGCAGNDEHIVGKFGPKDVGDHDIVAGDTFGPGAPDSGIHGAISRDDERPDPGWTTPQPDPGPAHEADPGRDEGPIFVAPDIPDEGPDEPVDPCPPFGGGFGCPCESGADCASGFCVASSTSTDVCTVSCIEGCPEEGWDCRVMVLPGQDTTQICMERGINLCRPCRTHGDCQIGNLGRPGDRCVSYGPEEGAFCGSSCEDHDDCTEGYECGLRQDVESGESIMQCVAKAGYCECSHRAIEEGASTFCARGQCLGSRRCTTNGMTECDAAYEEVEICNGQDDDCDELIDEEGAEGCVTYYLDHDGDGWGDDNLPGQCLCAPDELTGRVVTTAGDCQDNQPDIKPGAKEICNGVDDDCDGKADQGVEMLGVPCDGPDDDLCRNGVWTCTADGLDVECINEDPVGLIELCNGEDDNCDGLVDENFPEKGAACDGPDSDMCAFGTWTCSEDGRRLECVNEPPIEGVERCNGKDDDCDGETDEDYEGLFEACDSMDSDQCKNGITECRPNGLGVWCPFETETDIREVCNGLDDDCDGAIDEDFTEVGTPCDGEDEDLCKEGVYACSGGGGIVCMDTTASNPELCNGVDDDCDNLIDEGFEAKGGPCDGDDSDLCANGTWTCSEGGAALECLNETIRNIPEICNLHDDDCDGAIDETFPEQGAPCDGPDLDECIEGTLVCSKGGLACSDATSTNQELCNGKDDDCDEEVDEGFGQVDEPCDGPDIDFCKNGLWTCAPDGHGVVCQDDYPGDLVELCNGKDDNCNLSIDEDWADQLGQPCDTDDRDKCAYGTWVCADHGRGVVCEGDSPSDIVELCNGEDDDCDGETDEGYDLGGLCDRHDDQDSCSHGYLACDPNDPKALACLDDIPITNSEKIYNNSFEEGSKDWIVIDAGIDPAVLHRSQTEFEPRTGDWLMVLGGQNAWTTRVRQIIDVPESNTMLRLQFYWRIVTEDSSLTDYDALRVQLLDIANANIFNVLDVSNLDASDEWAMVDIEFPLAYAGQIVQVEFRGATDQTGVSWFLVDDVSVTARHCDD